MFLDEIFRHKLIFTENFTSPTILNNISILLLIFIIIMLYFFIKSNIDNKILISILFIIIIYIVLLNVNEKFEKNKNFSQNYIEPKILQDELNTGDIVLFKCYEYDSIDTPLYLFILSLFQNTFFSHIGIIYKDSNNETFIIESNGDPSYCELSKKIKNGFQFKKFINRIEETKIHRVHIVKNNIYQFIDNNKIINWINKYKNHKFLEDNINCIGLVVSFLQENNLLKNQFMPYLFEDLINPLNYNIPITFSKPILIKNYDN